MIFLANIGNTNLTCGFYDREIIVSERYPIADLVDEAGIERLCRTLPEKFQLPSGQIKGAVLSSVVPDKTPLLMEAVRSSFSLEPYLISEETAWKFDCSAYTGTLGTDRLLCCQAALSKYAPPFVVIDCGTATTLNVIDASGAFIGGVILPGAVMGIQALAAKTALLHTVSVSAPESVIGKNTAECMLSGAIYGTAAQLEGLVARIQRELKQDVAVILTGGNAGAILPYTCFPLRYEPNLLLEGLADKFKELRGSEAT
jgi:type III pantothenate kinase